MTPKQQVLKVYPKASIGGLLDAGDNKKYVIVNPPSPVTLSTFFDSSRAAWADAARRLKERT